MPMVTATMIDRPSMPVAEAGSPACQSGAKLITCSEAETAFNWIEM